MSAKRLRTMGATAVLVAIAAAGLVQLGTGTPAEITTAPDIQTPTSPPATAQPPFAYHIGLLAAPTSNNYWDHLGGDSTSWDTYVLGPTKPALYSIDPASHELIPELAMSGKPPPAERDGGGWAVTVELNADFAWSDGSPITAADIVYTFETVRGTALHRGWADAYPGEVESMTAEASDLLRIEFSTRPGLAVWPYGVGLAPVMPAHVWEETTEGLDAEGLYRLGGIPDVAGGALQIVDAGGTRIEAVANPGYPRQVPGEVVYTVFADEEAAVEGLREGVVHIVLNPNGLTGQSLNALQSTRPIGIEHSPANSVRYLGFNLTRDPMAEQGFRHALALLLDRESLTGNPLSGAAPAYTMLSPANQTWFDPARAGAIAGPYTRDLADRVSAAFAGLAEAGYAWDTAPRVVDEAISPGTGLTIDGLIPPPLTILTSGDGYDPARPEYTLEIEATLELIGFDVRPVVTDFDTVIDLAFAEDAEGRRQFDMYLLGWTLGNPALPDYHRRLFSTDGPANSTGYSSPVFDAHLARYEQATDLPAARNALWDMEETLALDLPYLTLYHPEMTEGYRTDRVGFGLRSVLGGIQGRLGGLADLIPAT